MRYINSNGLKIIKMFEGIEDGDPNTVNLDPYLCPANVWTIGWGHAIVYNNKLLTKEIDFYGNIAKELLYPDGLTYEECEELLIEDTIEKSNKVDELTSHLDLNDNQFSALVSLAYNIGIGNFKSSTLLRLLNEGDFEGASEQFQWWRKANGRILNGLVKRREYEKQLFLFYSFD